MNYGVPVLGCPAGGVGVARRSGHAGQKVQEEGWAEVGHTPPAGTQLGLIQQECSLLRGAESLRGRAGRGGAHTTCGDTVRITENGRNLFEEKSLELKK